MNRVPRLLLIATLAASAAPVRAAPQPAAPAATASARARVAR